MSDYKFKVGDRVRVVEGSEGDHVRVGAIGTVRELSICPWIGFDEPTGYQTVVDDIPVGHADCIEEERLELVVANALVLTAEVEGKTLAWGTKTDAFTAEHVVILTCAFESIKRLGGPALSIRTDVAP